MRTFTPIVITSKKAKRHIEHIKARHNEIVHGMATQKSKVDLFNQQKEIEKQALLQKQQEEKKMKLERQMKDRQEIAQTVKEHLDRLAKAKEVDLKRQALMK